MLINVYPMSQSSICNVMFSVDIVVCWQLKCISLMTPEHFKLNFWTTVYTVCTTVKTSYSKYKEKLNQYGAIQVQLNKHIIFKAFDQTYFLCFISYIQ